MKILLLIVLAILATVLADLPDENVADVAVEAVVGCGGFVNASPDLIKHLEKKPDYSYVKVELVTSDGIPKHSTECSPNGYYFIPMYEKGSYVLRVGSPDNWHFDPPQTAITIGDDGLCNGGGDINFVFTGFAVSGEIVVADAGQEIAGPSGMLVVLTGHTSVDPDTPVRLETTTIAGGEYWFSNIQPGEYTVSVTSDTVTFDSKRSSAAVKVEWGNARCETPFLITGFTIAGHVVSGGEPIHDVVFELYNAPESDSASEIKDKEKEKEMLGEVVARGESKEDGRFVVPNVRSGKYVLLPHHQSQAASFDIHPARVPITIDGDSVVIAQAFRVVGFSLGGRVLKGKGNAGFPGVKITVNGVERTVSDSNGKYVLDQLAGDAKYTVSASAPHVVFEELVNLDVSPNMNEIPAFKPVSYDICGSVMLLHPHPASSVWAGRKLRIVSADADATQTQYSTETDEDGRFCTSVPAGSYVVTPVLSTAESDAGVVVAPLERRIKVVDSPVLDAHFKEARTVVEGSVSCISMPCDPELKVILSLSPTVTASTATDGRLPMTTSVNSDGKFKFDGVLPGKYVTAVKMAHWCWEKETVPITVGVSGNSVAVLGDNDKLITLKFVQNGFLLTADLSHDAKLFFRLSDAPPSSTKSFELSQGTNNFCVAKPGSYVLTPRGCVQFEKDVYEYKTSDPQLIGMSASKYAVSGAIFVAPAAIEDESDIGIELEIESKSKGEGEDEVTVSRVQASLCESDSCKQEKVRIFNYTYWSAGDESITVTPQTLSKDSLYLFYPSHHNIDVAEGEGEGTKTKTKSCLPPLPAFEARLGLVLNGKVTPPLEDVLITVRRAKDNATVVSVQTDADGLYVAPPLHDDLEYRVSAEKEGYHFRRVTVGHFQAMKLGAVEITVVTEKGEPLSGVTMSLSGDAYRNNTAVPSGGVLTFTSLWPGSYFLRALLKEYVFEPAIVDLDVKEGATSKVSIKGTRVAWSVFGSVKSLNGEPQKSVAIDAVSTTKTDTKTKTKEHVEHTQSDRNGNYRVRGLKPGEQYVISVRKDAASVERSTPAQSTMTMAKKDVKNVDFVVFKTQSQHELFVTVHVHGPEDQERTIRDSLEVVVKKVSDDEIKSISLAGTAGDVVAFGSLAKGEYNVELRSSLSKVHYDYSLPSQHIQIGPDSVPRVVFDFSTSVKGQFGGSNDSGFGVVHPIISAVVILAVSIALFFFAELKMWYVGAPAPAGENEWLEKKNVGSRGRRRK